MSFIRVESISIKNYRSFGEQQSFVFPGQDYKRPVAIVGYNNCGKTNLMNAILYSLQVNFVGKDSFSIDDCHNRSIANIPEFLLNVSSSTEKKYDGKLAILNGWHKLKVQDDGQVIEGSKMESFKDEGLSQSNFQAFGATKYFNIFYVNFHNIKDEISTQKTSWGNLKSFLAKHIQKIVEKDPVMQSKKESLKAALNFEKNKLLEDSTLKFFIEKIQENYQKNLQDNNCEIDFSLPDYEEIFQHMLFKIGLNGEKNNLVPIDHFGDGFISMFVMAVIQAIAESSTDDKCLFLFEEPESFLHENHQEYFYKRVLCHLSESGHQVIYTTHSPKMIDPFDTQGLIRLELKDGQTINKYNDINLNDYGNVDVDNGQSALVRLDDYNQFVKSIEPNLGRILFSKKVLLVEGPNDLMVYKFAIENVLQGLGYNQKEAETYLSFHNIAVVPHHGKITALLLIKLCDKIRVEYFVINDWDVDISVTVEELVACENISTLTAYHKADREDKRQLNQDWQIARAAKNVHFNIPKLEDVIGYGSSDKNSVNIWNHIQKIEITENLFPKELKDFLEIKPKADMAIDPEVDETISVEEIPF